MGQSARCHISPRRLRHPESAISGTFQETSVDFCTSYLHFIAAPALLYLSRLGRLPVDEAIFYLVLVCIAGVSWVVVAIVAAGRRHRKNRFIERGLAEYMRKRTARQNS